MEIESSVDGAFCWAEGGVKDVAVAKAFYSAVLGWTYDDVPLPDGGVYPIAKAAGRSVGAIFKIDPKLAPPGAPPMPPAWSSYVQVADVDATAKRVVELGGAIVVPPMDVMEEGRMVVFSDPTGAVLSAWQPKRHTGFGRLNEHGAPCWFELMTKNLDVAQSFYERLFGWKKTASMTPGVQYIEITPPTASGPVGGLMQMDASFGDMPSCWSPYFTVANIETAASAVKANGGTVCVEPKDIPNVGTFAVVQDPGGAFFNIIQLSMK